MAGLGWLAAQIRAIEMGQEAHDCPSILPSSFFFLLTSLLLSLPLIIQGTFRAYCALGFRLALWMGQVSQTQGLVKELAFQKGRYLCQ